MPDLKVELGARPDAEVEQDAVVNLVEQLVVPGRAEVETCEFMQIRASLD